MHVDEQLSDSVMRRRNERIAEPRNEEVREELAHQEFPEEPYRRDPAKKVYQISDMTEDGPQVLKTTRSAAEMYQYVSGLKDEYVNDPQYKALKWDAEMERGYILYALAFGEEEQDGAAEHKHVFNLRKYPESEVEHIEKDGSLKFRSDSPYRERPFSDDTVAGRLRITTSLIVDEKRDGLLPHDIYAQYAEETYAKDFVEAVKEEDRNTDIQEHREQEYDPESRTVYQLYDLSWDMPVANSFSASEIYDKITSMKNDYLNDMNGSLEKDEDIYDYNEKSMNHEMEVRAYPESEIDEVDDEGIIRPKENSPYRERQDLDMQRAYSGTVAVEARCDDEDRIEDVSMQERFSTEFVKAVKKERPKSDIQKFREISISPDGETVDYSLNDIVKKSFLMADQQLEQPQKSQNRAAQAER